MVSASRDWWLLPDAFKGLGHNGSFSASETHYLGGWPGHAKTYTGKLTNILVIDRTGVALRGFSVIFRIPWNQITDIDVDGAENASTRVTASRALLLGPLALVAKKKTKHSMLIVTTRSGHQALFHSEQYTAPEMRMKLLPIMTRIRQAVVAQQPASPPGLVTAPPRAVSVADEQCHADTVKELNDQQRREVENELARLTAEIAAQRAASDRSVAKARAELAEAQVWTDERRVRDVRQEQGLEG